MRIHSNFFIFHLFFTCSFTLFFGFDHHVGPVTASAVIDVEYLVTGSNRSRLDIQVVYEASISEADGESSSNVSTSTRTSELYFYLSDTNTLTDDVPVGEIRDVNNNANVDILIIQLLKGFIFALSLGILCGLIFIVIFFIFIGEIRVENG